LILKYSLTPAEYRESQFTYRSRMASSRFLFRNLFLLAGLSAAIAVFLFFSGRTRGAAVFAVLGAGIVLERAVLFPWRLKKSKPGLIRDEDLVELRIDRDGLSWESNCNRGEQRWAYITTVRETKNLVLLQIQGGEALVIPKRAFPSGDFSRFLNLLGHDLIVKVERESSDTLLLKFAVSWGLGALLILSLGIGYLHTLLTGSSYSQMNPGYPRIIAAKPVPVSLDKLRGHGIIYLVPIGELSSSTPLAEARERFQYKYRVSINLLHPIPLPDWAKNQQRKQYAAEDLVLAMQLAYPEIASDPDAVLLGLTDADMYISALDWHYAFSFRDEERFGVISTAHLSEPAEDDDDKPVSAEVASKRLYKVLARDLGILHFRLQPASSYNSILARVDDASELDEIGDDYLQSDAEVRADLHVQDGDPCFVVRQYTDSARAHPQSGALRGCSGSYKELNLETIQVDLRYGLLLDQRTDFLIGDKFPLELTRVVRTQDDRSRAFGVGGSHSLNLFLVGDKWPFTTMELVLPDGGRAHFKRANWGFGYWDARYQNRDANWSKFAYSRISWGWPGWKLQRGIDVYQFPDRPDAIRPEQTALVSIEHGKLGTLVLNRDSNGNIRRAVSGRDELAFSNDEAGRVKKILEHEQPSNQFQYEYDTGGHLSRVTDAQGNISEYGYDRGHLASIKLNNTVLCTFEYDSADRVRKETLDGHEYEFRYQSGFRGQVGSVTILDSAGPSRVIRITGNEYTLDTIAESKVRKDTQK